MNSPISIAVNTTETSSPVLIADGTPHAAHLGVWLSAAHARATLVDDRSNQIIARREIALTAPDSLAAIIRDAGDIVLAIRREYPFTSPVTVAVAGLVAPDRRHIAMSSELPALTTDDFATGFEAAIGSRVLIENDARAAAFAEYKIGAGRGGRNLFYVTIGYGVGGCLIMNGEIWRGASGFAGEFGYVVIDPEGATLQSVASAPRIVERTRNRLLQDSTSSLSKLATLQNFTAADIARTAREGDDFAQMMIDRTGRYIGTALASVINLLNIERIVFGGGFAAEAGDLLIDAISREARKRSFRTSFEAAEILLAQLGADAVPLGAALLARETPIA